jgi:hypothetical protein
MNYRVRVASGEAAANGDEEWRTIEGFPFYDISNMGRVRSWKCYGAGNRRDSKPHLLKLVTGSCKYMQVNLHGPDRQKAMLIHRLVLETFRGLCPDGMESCHNNGDRSDNRFQNLRWDTHRSNIQDNRLHDSLLRGEKIGTSKLQPGEVLAIRAIHKCGKSLKSIAKAFGVSDTMAGKIVHRKAWTHI